MGKPTVNNPKEMVPTIFSAAAGREYIVIDPLRGSAAVILTIGDDRRA
jgi:hypothetical protein